MSYALPHPTASPSRQVPALAVATVLLLLLVLQGWAPTLLERPLPAWPTAAPAEAPRIDAAAVVDRARHAITPSAGATGTLEVADDTYRATFAPDGVTYTPRGADGGLGISLRSVERGGEALALDLGGWSGRSNMAFRPVAPAVTEQVTARAGEVEWDVVLGRRPAGSGDLVVRADLDGVARAKSAGDHWRLATDDGTRLRLGEIVVKDARSTVLHRALPAVDADAGTVELAVPAAVLDSAVYPLTVDPTVGGAIPVAAAGSRSSPSVAFDGANFLVVWQQGPSDESSQVFGARVSGDGAVVGGAFQISFDEGDLQSGIRPDVAWNGERFFVVWESLAREGTEFDVRGQFLDGSAVPTSSIAIATPEGTMQRAPAVTAFGSNLFVVWQDDRNGAFDIFGGRVNRRGDLSDGDGVRLTTRSQAEITPDVAFNGRDLLVTYQLTFSQNDEDVFAQLVKTSAVPAGDPAPLSTTEFNETEPAVGSNGSSWLVVYRDRGDIVGRRVNAFGTNDGEEITVCDFQDDQRDPAVAWNGTYLVTWADRRKQTDFDVFAARVRADGTVADPDGFAVAGTSADEDAPAVASAPSDDWAVASEAGPRGSTAIQQRFVSPK